MMTLQKQYDRFSVVQRIEHWVLFLSFTTLAVTGIPQKFVGSGWAEAAIAAMGGIETIRTIHHVAAIILSLEAIYHAIVIGYKIFVLRVRWTMFPRLDDALDALDALLYNLGLSKKHPRFDHFNFAEKAEYWAMIWGTVVMGLTGFIMWNPINAARIMPGDMIPASKAAHGAEALLAVLAILVWHVYNVHIKSFNKTVFTGKLSEAQMKEEHPVELDRIKAGKKDPVPTPQMLAARRRSFIPVAGVVGLIMVGTVSILAFGESTAVSPDWTAQRSVAQVYVPVTPTPTAKPGTTPTATSSGITTLPADHVGRDTCLSCHATLPDPKLPADHQGRTDATCTSCHKPAGTAASGATPAAPGTPGPGATPATSGTAAPTTAGQPVSSTISPIPASHTVAHSTDCLACHQNLTSPKLPDDHKGRTNSMCTSCHKPAGATGGTTTPATSGTSAGAPKPQPASHVGRTVCLGCHQALTDPKLPADHAGRAETTCVACHKAP